MYPDPERPLDIDPSLVSPFLRWQDESEPDWLRRLAVAASGPRSSIERLAIIREAILREIGFYDLGSRPAGDRQATHRSAWSVLAALQNVPLDGWQSALPFDDDVRSESERTGTLPYLGALGPDGNIYNRLSIAGENPVGDLLTSVDERIGMMQLADPNFDVRTILPAIAISLAAVRGGGSARPSLATTVAPRIQQFVRSRGGVAATGLTSGLGLGVAADAIVEGSRRSEMEAAPDLPAARGFEPPEPPADDESFDEASIDVETVPGFEFPDSDGPMVLIFPDVSDEIEQILIIERRERQETRDQIDAIRDFYLRLHPDWTHYLGGRDEKGIEMSEFRVEGPGVAFSHPITGKPSDSRPGSIYVDLTFETPTGLVHVQTVDIDRDGLPTERELRTARRLADVTGRPVYIVPKTWQHL